MSNGNRISVMTKQFTIITKYGSKWLRPSLGTATHLISPDLPYLGSRPEGAVLDESEVREVRQYRKIGAGLDWTTCPSEQVEKAAAYRPSFELRTAYNDVKSHDRHIRPFRIHNVRPLVNQLVGEEISFSRFIELLNEIANGN